MARGWRVPLLSVIVAIVAEAAWAGPAHVVKRDTSAVRFKVVYLREWVHVRKVPADIVINANFYWRGAPLGILVKEGRLVNGGLKQKPPRTSFVVQQVNGQQRVRILEVYEKGGRLYTSSGPLTNVRTLVQAGPRLVATGQVAVARTQEGFRNDVARRTRHVGLGLTGDGKLLIVAQSDVTLTEFARTFVRLGAQDAMNLDGGSSATLAVNGKVRMGSGRILAGLAINSPK